MPGQGICTPVIYKPVVGFPGYRVGDDGSVWSCWRNGGDDRAGQVLTDKWRHLKGWVDKRRGRQDGYVKVGLMREGKLHHLRVHVLVLTAFVGPCPAGMEVRHLDDDKANNRLTNLCWGTRQENAQDKIRNGLMPMGERHYRAKLRRNQIPEVRALLDAGLSERKVATRFGVSKGTIRAIRLGRTWREVG